jgi:hypothetical protein
MELALIKIILEIADFWKKFIYPKYFLAPTILENLIKKRNCLNSFQYANVSFG